MLIAQGMGLGGWIHAAVERRVFERDPASENWGSNSECSSRRRGAGDAAANHTAESVGIDSVLEP
jgi:hypothetical protein